MLDCYQAPRQGLLPGPGCSLKAVESTPWPSKSIWNTKGQLLCLEWNKFWDVLYALQHPLFRTQAESGPSDVSEFDSLPFPALLSHTFLASPGSPSSLHHLPLKPLLRRPWSWGKVRLTGHGRGTIKRPTSAALLLSSSIAGASCLKLRASLSSFVKWK